MSLKQHEGHFCIICIICSLNDNRHYTLKICQVSQPAWYSSLLVKKYEFRYALQSEMACFAFKRLGLYEQHETACDTLDESLGWLFYGSALLCFLWIT